MEGEETSGISRSGRIRKKSSKLRDYHSPEDVDATPGPSTKRQRQTSEMKMVDVVGDFEDGEGSQSDDMGTGSGGSAPNRSIYMSEKNSTKRDKDGRVLRQQRKDKGKARLTAYMLWSRNARQNMKDGADLDFANKSRRLGELWANVPKQERMTWKRRVKQQNKARTKATTKPTVAAVTTTSSAAGNNSKFLNKSRTRQSPAGTHTTPRKSIPPTETKVKNGTNAKKIGKVLKRPLECTDPMNVAAHLKLLGDSLSNIGESLKQHEGRHNSVTGTVSVLLDSLLCSVVPLICLTTQIQGFGDRVVHLKDSFQNTLDNIAYVMPGLPF